MTSEPGARVLAAARALFGEEAPAVLARIAAVPSSVRWPGPSDRLLLAILRLSGGDRARLEEAIALAERDWRDLLVAAGFADDTTAHERWIPGE